MLATKPLYGGQLLAGFALKNSSDIHKSSNYLNHCFSFINPLSIHQDYIITFLQINVFHDTHSIALTFTADKSIVSNSQRVQPLSCVHALGT